MWDISKMSIHCNDCRELRETDSLAMCEYCIERRYDYYDEEMEEYNEAISEG